VGKNREDYPLVMTAEDIREILGVGRRKAYEIMDENGFPLVSIGKKLKRVNRDDFFRWLDHKAKKQSVS
jgi:Helix-turn-helix domain